MVKDPRRYDYDEKVLSFYKALRVNDINALFLSWDATPNDVRVRVLGNLAKEKGMTNIVTKNESQWQKAQFMRLLNQKWKELGGEDIKEMVQLMRKSYDWPWQTDVPADW